MVTHTHTHKHAHTVGLPRRDNAVKVYVWPSRLYTRHHHNTNTQQHSQALLAPGRTQSWEKASLSSFRTMIQEKDWACSLNLGKVGSAHKVFIFTSTYGQNSSRKLNKGRIVASARTQTSRVLAALVLEARFSFCVTPNRNLSASQHATTNTTQIQDLLERVWPESGRSSVRSCAWPERRPRLV
jgi:hypothetical protein